MSLEAHLFEGVGLAGRKVCGVIFYRVFLAGCFGWGSQLSGRGDLWHLTPWPITYDSPVTAVKSEGPGAMQMLSGQKTPLKHYQRVTVYLKSFSFAKQPTGLF